MTDLSDNLVKQDEEIEALCAIYGSDWGIESDVTRTYRVRVEDNKQEVLLHVTMPPEYPSLAPPKLELSAPWMQRKDKCKLLQELDEVYLENVGETVVYQWVEKIRETLFNMKLAEKALPSTADIEAKALKLAPVVSHCPEILHGEVNIDRKSVFQGHMARVRCMDDVKAVLAKLQEIRKIQSATHNMWGYRFTRQPDPTKPQAPPEKGARGARPEPPKVIGQDYFDDGEDRGGMCIMKLLLLRNVVDVLVVVSRWYGGIQLGPDRFHNINRAARSVLEQGGLLKKVDC